MELSLEEKKAIELLKNKNTEYYYRFIDVRDAVSILLKLTEKQQKEIEGKNAVIDTFEHTEKVLTEQIDKQQKEIEELKKPKYLAHFENNKITKMELINDFISKDKIREKIKHYNDELEHIKNGEEFENEKPMYYWGKAALENLLEEN